MWMQVAELEGVLAAAQGKLERFMRRLPNRPMASPGCGAPRPPCGSPSQREAGGPHLLRDRSQNSLPGMLSPAHSEDSLVHVHGPRAPSKPPPWVAITDTLAFVADERVRMPSKLPPCSVVADALCERALTAPEVQPLAALADLRSQLAPLSQALHEGVVELRCIGQML